MKRFMWSSIRRLFRVRPAAMSSAATLSGSGGIPLRQTKLAPDGLTFCEDVSEAVWVTENLSGFGTLRALLPGGFPAYARVLHPAYLDGDRDRPVRWSTAASWTGRTVHPLMQFERIANLAEDPRHLYPDPPWGDHPDIGSIPEAECGALIAVLRRFTTTPADCFFCLWEGYGNIDKRLYKARARVRAPGRDYLLFRGPLDAALQFIDGDRPFWRDSPNLWWPADRAWCVATDIDLYDTYVGGSAECVEAVLAAPDLEAFATTLDARVDIGADVVNAPDTPDLGGQ